MTLAYLPRVGPDIDERDVFLRGPPIVMRKLREDLARADPRGQRDDGRLPKGR